MKPALYRAVAIALITVSLGLDAQGQTAAPPKYEVTVLPPGGPTPRLPDGHPDFSGHWFPNGAGQGVSGRYGVDPAATRQFDPKATPEERPVFQAWALEKIKSMTPTELELSKSSVNCMPRGVPAIWLQNPYTTYIMHQPGVMAQLYEVLNNWRLIPSRSSMATARPAGTATPWSSSPSASTNGPTFSPTAGFTATSCA
jgi:hypothetical protein